MAGLAIYYGEILSEESEHGLDTQNLNHLLSATENDFYNALVCKAKGRQVGHHRAFQVTAHRAADQGVQAHVDRHAWLFCLLQHSQLHLASCAASRGWAVQSTRLSESHGWNELEARLKRTQPRLAVARRYYAPRHLSSLLSGTAFSAGGRLDSDLFCTADAACAQVQWCASG